MRRAETPAGFTLIEVMVSLTIGSMVVLMVHAAFSATADLGTRLEGARVQHRAAMTAVERLTLAFGSIDLTTARGKGFDGNPAEASFTTSLPWLGPPPSSVVPVRLRVEGGRLTLLVAGGRADSLLAADDLAFDYLLAMGAESRWIQSWRSPVSAPVAVRLRLRHDNTATADTLLFLVGH